MRRLRMPIEAVLWEDEETDKSGLQYKPPTMYQGMQDSEKPTGGGKSQGQRGQHVKRGIS
jgi:hypothetical protein